ncbi:MAG: polysaccharide biosynthesis/export family protein [Lacipirellulaceae bacterium]
MLNLSRMASTGNGGSLIAAGDLLSVTVSTGRTGERPAPTLARVDDSGNVDVPLVGPVQVAGLEPPAASQVVSSAAVERGIYRQPHISVEMKTKAVNKITVIGAIKKSGLHELPRDSSDLLAALTAAGGLAEDASTMVDIMQQPPKLAEASSNPSDVQLAGYRDGQTAEGVEPAGFLRNRQRRGYAGPRSMRIDLEQLSQQGGVAQPLSDGDVVMVLPKEKRVVHISGLVKKPNQFELPPNQDVYLLDAVAMAGGISSPVANKVLVIRRLPNQTEPVVIQASLARAKTDGAENLRLAPGDMVSVERTPATIVVDTIGKFFRVAVSGSTALF